MANIEYSSTELMIVNSARLLKDSDVVFVGVGLPNLACNLAQRTHAPQLQMIYEAGVIGARPARLPLSIGDPTLVSGAASVCSMYDIFTLYLQRGNVDVGFLGGAQLDGMVISIQQFLATMRKPEPVFPDQAVRRKLPPGPTAAISSPRTKNAAFPKRWISGHLPVFSKEMVKGKSWDYAAKDRKLL